MAALNKDALQALLKRKKICRFCLCQDHSKLTNIYLRDTRIKSSAPLPIQIMAIASIEVFSNDDMPSYVCCTCTDMFEFSYQFKQMCKKADNVLRQFPLTGKCPDPLDKPVLRLPQVKNAKATTQTRINISTKNSAQQESLVLPRKILNASIMPNNTEGASVITPDISAGCEETLKCTITFLDKIENNDELSLDDIQQLVAAEEISEREYGNTNNDDVLPAAQINKPKVLNKSSIRILNKEAEPENEPRLSLPKIYKDVDGKTEIIAEILNEGDIPEGEPDPTAAAVIETNVFPCNFCERTFPLLQLRDIHMKNHFRDRKFPCEYCDKSFFSKHDLRRHSYVHSGERPYKCSVCDLGFSRTTLLTRHEKTHTDVPKYICVHCERSFLLKEDMEKHVERKHNKNRPFVCKICDKRFAFKQGVERHEVVHSRLQPYTCQYCDESFSTTTKLARHLTAHAGVRPYPCRFCTKSYLLSHHLTRHLRCHKTTETISFKCVRCTKSFGTRDELIIHSATHANEMSLECPLCNDVFEKLPDLTSHIELHSGEAYACEFCDLIFLTAEKLQLHTDHEHAVEMEVYRVDDKERQDKYDEKLQNTVNEFLDGESTYEDNNLNDSEAKVVKKEKRETQSPTLNNQIIIDIGQSGSGAESILIPLKQRKLDVPSKLNTSQSKPSPEPTVRRKVSIAKSAAGIEPNKSKIQSLLKTQTAAVKRSSNKKALPRQSPTVKTSPSKTPPTKMILTRKIRSSDSLTTAAVIKVENETPEEEEPSTSVNDANTKTKSGRKKTRIQKITVTKAQAAAMVKEGRIKIEDGKIILKK